MVKKKHREIRSALIEHLPCFIADLQRMPQARLRLSDVPEHEIKELAQSVGMRMKQFGKDVKGLESPVLPSKTAHLLLTGCLPAFDQKVAKNTTLSSLIARGRTLSDYLMICWWICRQFAREGTLQQARDRVAEFLLSDWAFCILRPQNLSADHWLLRSLDSLVAEYALIGMYYTVKNSYLLRWL